MPDRLVIVLASGDPHVLEMGLTYARNVVKREWMKETKLFLFGPSEVQAATDPALREAVKTLVSDGLRPVACKYCSDRYAVSEALVELGCDVDYVGEPMSAAIRDGFVPVVW